MMLPSIIQPLGIASFLNYAIILETKDVEIAAAAAVAIALLGLLINTFLNVRNQTRVNQPVVLLNEREPPLETVLEQKSALGYLTNDGRGSAFNVRFGIKIGRSRWAFKLEEDDPSSGNLQRVIKEGARLPERDAHTDTYPLNYPIELIFEKKGYERRKYWCRYQNAIGHTWETINPADRSKPFKIKRVRFVRTRLWLDSRTRVWRLKRMKKKWENIANDLKAEAKKRKAAAQDDKTASHIGP